MKLLTIRQANYQMRAVNFINIYEEENKDIFPIYFLPYSGDEIVSIIIEKEDIIVQDEAWVKSWDKQQSFEKTVFLQKEFLSTLPEGKYLFAIESGKVIFSFDKDTFPKGVAYFPVDKIDNPIIFSSPKEKFYFLRTKEMANLLCIQGLLKSSCIQEPVLETKLGLSLAYKLCSNIYGVNFSRADFETYYAPRLTYKQSPLAINSEKNYNKFEEAGILKELNKLGDLPTTTKKKSLLEGRGEISDPNNFGDDDESIDTDIVLSEFMGATFFNLVVYPANIVIDVVPEGYKVISAVITGPKRVIVHVFPVTQKAKDSFILDSGWPVENVVWKDDEEWKKMSEETFYD